MVIGLYQNSQKHHLHLLSAWNNIFVKLYIYKAAESGIAIIFYQKLRYSLKILSQIYTERLDVIFFKTFFIHLFFKISCILSNYYIRCVHQLFVSKIILIIIFKNFRKMQKIHLRAFVSKIFKQSTSTKKHVRIF